MCARGPTSAPTSGPTPDQLQIERERLVFARQCLEAMREAVRSLDPQGGDRVSTEYLKAELFRRLQALLDDPNTPLFFGRIDQTETSERFYVGRRHVRDKQGDPVVVDWRADISRSFYRASSTEPMGVSLRRRFGFSHGVMTSLEDERLDRGEARDPATSRILTDEIERPRVGPMRDIVATIQPDQDELVRSDLSETVCIQGAPGTGKTAVGLHRAAYLLYAFREQLQRTGVLVVGPNRSFLSYIGDLLPALGELDAQQVAVQELVSGVRVRAEDDADVLRVKGDERMAQVVRTACFAGVVLPREDLRVHSGTRWWRIPRHELVELIDRERRERSPYDVARTRLASLLAESVRRRIEAAGGAPDDRAVSKLSRSADIKGWVDAHWPAVTAAGVVFRLLSDREFLEESSLDLLDEAERNRLLWDPAPAGPRQARWTVADTFLIDEAAGVLQRPPTFGHVVVDEAQDLSAMQCRAIGRRCPSGSATILGDIAQATAAGAVADWSRTLSLIGREHSRIVALSRGYRVPAEVLDFANQLLPALQVQVAPAESLRHHPGALRLHSVAAVGDALPATVAELLSLEGSIGVIGTDDDIVDARKVLRPTGADVDTVDHGMEAKVTLVPVTLCKGLEFDHVVVLEPAAIASAHARGLNWLYVALTRAVTTLTVLHAQALPAPCRRPAALRARSEA